MRNVMKLLLRAHFSRLLRRIEAAPHGKSRHDGCVAQHPLPGEIRSVVQPKRRLSSRQCLRKRDDAFIVILKGAPNARLDGGPGAGVIFL
jgi:hypothetical protein